MRWQSSAHPLNALVLRLVAELVGLELPRGDILLEHDVKLFVRPALSFRLKREKLAASLVRSLAV